MLARHDGRVVLVSGAIPGERVHARVERANRKVVWAEVTEVIFASPDRRTPSFDPRCGGALYAHIAYERQRQLKSEVVVDAFRRIGKMDVGSLPPAAASPEEGYRVRARLHVRGGRAGFFREGSHVICDAGPTKQLSAGALEAVESLVASIGDGLALVDSVIVAENVAATERALHVVPIAGSPEPAPAGGPATVTDTAADVFGADPPIAPSVVWRRGADAFFQANRFLLGPLLRTVLAAAAGERCADLYSGVGLFAIALAARGSRVIAVEGDPVSARDLLVNAEAWPSNVRVLHAAVEGFLHRIDAPAPDVLILDPPRTGASPEALDGVVRWAAPRVVYVSCDPPTLARDAARLVAGGYRLAALEAFDLFPTTPHVETVAVFDRA